MDTSDPEAWLRARHAQMTTPPELIDAYVKKASASRPVSSRRLVIGQMNEVYDVITDAGKKLIVRISHVEDPRFEAERWALGSARLMGAPTPAVLLVENFSHDGRLLAVCVEEKLPGEPLDVLLTRGPAKAEVVDIQQVSRVLAKIHSVPVEGFGYLRPDGRGWDISFADIMLDLNEKRDELVRAAGRWGVARAEAEAGLSLLNASRGLYEWDDPHLVHGDFAAEHILVENGCVTGVLDFQECSGGHPVFDFVQWHVTGAALRHPVSLGKLMAAYPDQALFGDDFERLFDLVLIRRSLWMLMVHAEQENPHGVAAVRDSLRQGLAATGPPRRGASRGGGGHPGPGRGRSRPGPRPP